MTSFSAFCLMRSRSRTSSIWERKRACCGRRSPVTLCNKSHRPFQRLTWLFESRINFKPPWAPVAGAGLGSSRADHDSVLPAADPKTLVASFRPHASPNYHKTESLMINSQIISKGLKGIYLLSGFSGILKRKSGSTTISCARAMLVTPSAAFIISSMLTNVGGEAVKKVQINVAF